METRRRNITSLGLLVLVAGVLGTWGFFYLLNQPFLGGGTKVVLALEDGAALKRGDRVELQGVEVGSVRNVTLEHAKRVAVELRLNRGVKLPADTRAGVRGDVFGARTVDLIPGSAMVMLEPGDTIRGASAPALPELMAGLSDQAQHLMVRADSLLSPRAVADVHATAQVLPASVRELKAVFVELRAAAASLRRSAEGVEGASAGPALASALGELEGSALAFTSAAGAMERSMGSLASVLAKVDQGEGTLGRLVNDSSLYNELYAAVREVRILAADVRERPKRYVSIEIF